MVCNAMRILYVLSFLFFGYDLHNNNNNYYKNNNFNTHNIINTRTCRPTSTQTTNHPRYHHHALQIAYSKPNANCHFNHKKLYSTTCSQQQPHAHHIRFGGRARASGKGKAAANNCRRCEWTYCHHGGKYE